jgi:hypothetical protein
MTLLEKYWPEKMRIKLRMPDDLLDVTSEEVDRATISASQKQKTDIRTAILIFACLSPVITFPLIKNTMPRLLFIGFFLLISWVSLVLYGAGKKYLYFKLLICELRKLRTNN